MTEDEGETIGFRMQLRDGCQDEYRRRHDAIWPELVDELYGAGIREYRIFWDPDNNCLFALVRRSRNHTMDRLPESAVVRRWWSMMADLMMTEPDLAPSVTELQPMFRLGVQ
jgi:L-rhamnose mutarotase